MKLIIARGQYNASQTCILSLEVDKVNQVHTDSIVPIVSITFIRKSVAVVCRYDRYLPSSYKTNSLSCLPELNNGGL